MDKLYYAPPLSTITILEAGWYGVIPIVRPFPWLTGEFVELPPGKQVLVDEWKNLAPSEHAAEGIIWFLPHMKCAICGWPLGSHRTIDGEHLGPDGKYISGYQYKKDTGTERIPRWR